MSLRASFVSRIFSALLLLFATALAAPHVAAQPLPGPGNFRGPDIGRGAGDEDEEKKPEPDNAPLATPSGTVSHSTQSVHHMDTTPTAKAKPQEKLDLENTLYLDLAYGRVTIKLHPELAPKTVARIKQLVREGFYDGLVFHRVIDGFMAQTGDPRGDGTGGSGQNIDAEFNAGKHVRGAVSMARASNINSADSQFFIVLADSPHLDGQYTYFGEVVDGMEYVDQIAKGDPRRNGAVPYPDHIILMQVAADAQKNDKGAGIVREKPKPVASNGQNQG